MDPTLRILNTGNLAVAKHTMYGNDSEDGILDMAVEQLFYTLLRRDDTTQ